MIRIGLDAAAKATVVRAEARARGVERVVVLTHPRFPWTADLDVPTEVILWADVITYRVYYRLLRELGDHTLLVVHECLRGQDRHALAYNCVRHYANHTRHVLVLQRLPIIDALADFAVLFDLATRSRWKRSSLSPELLREADIAVADSVPAPTPVRLAVPIDAKLQATYEREKRALFAGIGQKDPDTIPRNLLLVGGRAKANAVGAHPGPLVGRNNRLGLPSLVTFDAVQAEQGPFTVFELCHDAQGLADFVALTARGATEVPVLVTELKVDAWYFDRFNAWCGRVRDACAVLRTR